MRCQILAALLHFPGTCHFPHVDSRAFADIDISATDFTGRYLKTTVQKQPQTVVIIVGGYTTPRIGFFTQLRLVVKCP